MKSNQIFFTILFVPSESNIHASKKRDDIRYFAARMSSKKQTDNKENPKIYKIDRLKKYVTENPGSTFIEMSDASGILLPKIRERLIQLGFARKRK